MAFIRDEYCRHCEKPTSHVNGVCSICSARKNRERISNWNALPDDEKFQDLRRRIESLEAGPPRY